MNAVVGNATIFPALALPLGYWENNQMPSDENNKQR
jgi:hypothetical protein